MDGKLSSRCQLWWYLASAAVIAAVLNGYAVFPVKGFFKGAVKISCAPSLKRLVYNVKIYCINVDDYLLLTHPWSFQASTLWLVFPKRIHSWSASGSDSFYGNEKSNVISLSGVSVTVFAPPWVVVAMCVFVNAHLTYAILPTLYK